MRGQTHFANVIFIFVLSDSEHQTEGELRLFRSKIDVNCVSTVHMQGKSLQEVVHSDGFLGRRRNAEGFGVYRYQTPELVRSSDKGVGRDLRDSIGLPLTAFIHAKYDDQGSLHILNM